MILMTLVEGCKNKGLTKLMTARLPADVYNRHAASFDGLLEDRRKLSKPAVEW